MHQRFNEDVESGTELEYVEDLDDADVLFTLVDAPEFIIKFCFFVVPVLENPYHAVKPIRFPPRLKQLSLKPAFYVLSDVILSIRVRRPNKLEVLLLLLNRITTGQVRLEIAKSLRV